MPYTKTRAAFVGERGNVEVRTLEVPELEEGSILVRMRSSGICGTDLEKLTGAYTASMVLGHEVAGTVEDSRSSEFGIGDTVIPHHHVACGNCVHCNRGAETMCEGFRTSNFVPCGFADVFKVPEYNVSRGGIHRFARISFEEASFAEPLGCCIRGLEKSLHSKLDPAQQPNTEQTGNQGNLATNVLVVGAGPIGLLHMELLHSRFQDLKIVAVDVIETRLAFAERFESARGIMPSKTAGTFAEESKKALGIDGFDLVVVATGNPVAFGEAVKSCRKSGSLLLFGAPHKGSTYSMDLQSMFLSELALTSSYATTEKEIAEAISLLESGRIDVKKFITGRFPLEKINDAMIAARGENHVKILIDSDN